MEINPVKHEQPNQSICYPDQNLIFLKHIILIY
jgi:hypothetical protein